MIQVWFEGKKMGALNISVPKEQKFLTLHELDELDFSESTTSLIRERTWKIGRRTHRIDGFDMARDPNTLQTVVIHQLGLDPASVEVIDNPAQYTKLLRWPTIVAENIDQWEYLFDRTEFIPC